MKNVKSVIILTVFIFLSLTNAVEVLEERKIIELQKLEEANLLNDESILKVNKIVNNDNNSDKSINNDKSKKSFKSSLVTGFLLIFISEIGDNTFIIALIFSLKFGMLNSLVKSNYV